MNDYQKSNINPSASKVALEPDQRRSAAYHVAAHAVVGYWFGWNLNADGVAVGERNYCGHDVDTNRFTREAHVCVLLAGWLAETLLYPSHALRHSDDRLRTELDAIFGGASALSSPSAELSDEYYAFLHLLLEQLDLGRNPVTLDTLISAFRACETKTLDLMMCSEIWCSIERIAAALLERGHLSDREASSLLSWDIYTGEVPDAPSERDM